MIDQKTRLEHLENRLKSKDIKDWSMPVKIAMKKLELIRKNPEWNNKLNHFMTNEVFCTSNKDVIIYLEVGKVLKR